MADESIISQTQNSLDNTRNKKAEQPNKKFKKKRSIRFSRVASLKPSSRRFNSSGLNFSSPFDLASDDSSLQQSSSVASSDSAPNCINNSSSSFVENKGGSECDDANSMVSSSSGSTDRVLLQPSAVILSDDGAEGQNSHSKELSEAKGFSDGRKTPNVRNPKVLIKKVSFKPNMVSKKSVRMNEDEAYVDRATCSSIIKDARFPEHIELQPGEKGSDRISSAKVCRYHHCSLNGHCHDAHTPVKKFPFRRRKPAKPLMNTKSNGASGPRAKISADRKEPKKPEITDSVGDSSNKHTLKKNDKSKDSKGTNHSEVTAKGPNGLDQEPYLKSKSSENIPSDIAKNLSSGVIDESIKDSNVMYSAPDSYSSRLNVNDEESRSNQKSEQVLFESTRAGDLEDLSSLKVQSPQFRREKHITMWHLIHKQMISSLAEEDAANTPKTVLRSNEEKELKETKEDTPDGSYHASQSDSDATINNIEEGNREMEIHKLFAIKLVREAIEKILLPELQDQSSETQSITSDITEDQQLPKENHLEVPGEGHENHSTDSNGNSATSDVLGVVARTNDSIDPANNKSETRVKSEKKSPSNWSSLKKWILLQRFVKQLEKVRKFKPRNPSNVPLETDPEGEKVNLRRQTVERKRSEEWMLDYAIRQVVGQLAPTQKRKVALLVKAFETIVPPQDDHSTQVSWPQLKGQRHESVILTSKVDAPEDMKPEAQGKVMPKPDVDVQLSNGTGHQIHGSMANDFQFSEKSAEFARSLHENVPPTEESQQQINSQSLHENVPPTEESQQQINSQKMYSLSTGNLLDDHEAYSNHEKRDVASSTIRSTTRDIDVKPKVTEETELEQPEITKENLEILAEEKRMKSEAEQTNNVAEETLKAAGYSTLLQESTARKDRGTQLKPERTLSRESSLDSRLKGNEKGESQLDKENYIIMWHMIYQHVASNIASKVGSHLLGGEEDKKVKDFNTSSDIVTSSPQVISTEESHAAAMEKNDFSKSDAVKLIQEAVDEILLHDVPDDDASSDTQSVASETTPDLYLYEKNRDEVLYKSVSNTSVLNEEYVREFDRSDSGISVEETKATLPKPKSWRKLKRLMLLKRSIKAMERARKLKSLLPRKNLPMPSNAEPERVDLKHQMVNERKKAEKWMLDYAVRNIVSELTPARKTRVAMLVEAFEAVVPLPEM